MPELTRTLAALAAALLLAGCAGASPDARRAGRLLARGDHAGAERAADEGLARAPRDAALWRIKMRAALAAGDARRAVAHYDSWRELRGEDDPEALRLLARTTLWQGLHAGTPPVQTRAVQAVERLRLEELSPDVAELVTSEDDRVAAAAGSALLAVHPSAPRVMVDLLRSEDVEARAIAVDGIGRKAGYHARADLVPMLGDPAPRVRRAAIGAVAGFAEDEELERLAAMARDDADGTVRAAALRAIARRSPEGRVELARAALADAHPGARRAAVELLVRDGSDEARAVLAQVAAGDDVSLALAAAGARLRGGFGGEADLAVFDRALADPRWNARAAALNASGAAPRELALRLAGRAIIDPRAEVRLAAARVLLRLDTAEERARQELAAALAAADLHVRIDAATDLVRMGDPRGAEVLAELAGHEAAAVRGGAVRAHASARRITPGLVRALADPDPLLRLVAAELLVELTPD